MKRVQEIETQLRSSIPMEQQTSNVKIFTPDDIAIARDKGQYLLVLHNKVYDVTNFLDEHPGGAEIITDLDQIDPNTSAEFDNADHSEEALQDLQDLFIGNFVSNNIANDAVDNSSQDFNISSIHKEENSGQLNLALEKYRTEIDNTLGVPREQQLFHLKNTEQELDAVLLKLEDKLQLSHDAFVFRFTFAPTQTSAKIKNYKFSLPVGQHISIQFVDASSGSSETQIVSRQYTPLSPIGDADFLDLLVKIYPNGRMSQHLLALSNSPTHELSLSLEAKGPRGGLVYLGEGRLKVKGLKTTRTVRRLNMVCGGSGITPMYQILQALARELSSPNSDKAQVPKARLLYANKTEEDILLRKQLENFANRFPDHISVTYTVDSPPKIWNYFVGFVNKPMLEKAFGADNMRRDDEFILLCGPPVMMKKAVLPALKEMDLHPRTNYFTF